MILLHLHQWCTLLHVQVVGISNMYAVSTSYCAVTAALFLTMLSS